MITHHTQLLNALIEKYNLRSYLEIGVQNPANNFDKIKAQFKIGIEPDKNCKGDCILNITSDEYFESRVPEMPKWDLCFIDGFHEKDQVKRDFENSLRCLSDHGFIVIHDVLPENEAGTKVPRETKRWWGDVYKFAMKVQNYDGIGMATFDIDNGCMLVWKVKTAIGSPIECNTDWDSYLTYGKTFMNVTSTVEI
jgi:hypothetical protein